MGLRVELAGEPPQAVQLGGQQIIRGMSHGRRREQLCYPLRTWTAIPWNCYAMLL